MNNVSLIGRITSELEVKQTTTGKSVLNFCVAVNKDRDTTYFIDCVAWNNTATNIARYLKKGSQIGISGMLTTRTSEYNGQKRKYTEVMVNAFDFIGSKAENGGDNSPTFAPPVTPKFEEIDTDDSLPF
jgi:single-strand DNA-binding protein